jgi:uncharacterized protein (DUF2141 family)
MFVAWRRTPGEKRGVEGALPGGRLRLGYVAVALSLVLAQVSAEAAISIAINVHGVRSDAGEVVAVLYGDNPDDFLKKGKRLARERMPARPGSVSFTLPAPGPGIYAVAVYHDENGNRKLDRTLVGLPSEGFGLSNNPALRLRVPRLADAAFSVAEGRAPVDISLKY